MIPNLRLALLAAFASAFLAAPISSLRAQEDASEAAPDSEPSSFANKSIDEMTAEEVLRLVRYSYTLYNRDFTGQLRMGLTKSVPFLLSLKPEAISFVFNEPAQIIMVDTRNQRFTLLEGIAGAEARPVTPSKYGEAIRGTDVTYDDLSMRFLYWPDARIVAQEKLKGRDTIRVRIRNPDGAGAYASVEVWIDKLSGGMLKMIGSDRSGRPIRRFEVLHGKKFGDVWMVDEMRIETLTGASGGTVKSATRLQIKGVQE
jgi:hypothetical protein